MRLSTRQNARICLYIPSISEVTRGAAKAADFQAGGGAAWAEACPAPAVAGPAAAVVIPADPAAGRRCPRPMGEELCSRSQRVPAVFILRRRRPRTYLTFTIASLRTCMLNIC